MKTIYLVTEGPTDRIVIEGLVAHWLGNEDFIARHIQPPSSAYVEDLESNLSDGWKGVQAWCEGRRTGGPAGRDEALLNADCLFIHIDADVATDADFKNPAFSGPCPPAVNACDWVRNHLISLLGGAPPNVVFCVPSKDIEAWVISALHPDIADDNTPIECRTTPGSLLVQRRPYRLVRRKNGGLKKDPQRYESAIPAIVKGWANCVSGTPPRCQEAMRFEQETKQVLGI